MEPVGFEPTTSWYLRQQNLSTLQPCVLSCLQETEFSACPSLNYGSNIQNRPSLYKYYWEGNSVADYPPPNVPLIIVAANKLKSIMTAPAKKQYNKVELIRFFPNSYRSPNLSDPFSMPLAKTVRIKEI